MIIGYDQTNVNTLKVRICRTVRICYNVVICFLAAKKQRKQVTERGNGNGKVNRA